ncbi:MAG: SEL1-like repeat protein [Candidatus Methanomethylophilaceae archaeon]|nr:SEL1-like repeat protein [Candidatus Methanomethylophilaceae archaeon]
MGQMYEHGLGVKASNRDAARCFESAMVFGSHEAEWLLNSLRQRMDDDFLPEQ